MIVPPTPAHLARAYFELSLHGARAVGEKRPWPYRPKELESLLVLCAELSRYDPRLFGILVEFLVLHWRELNPLRLRLHLREAATPQTLLAAFGFAVSGAEDAELNGLIAYLGRAFSPVPPQLYFLSLYKPAGTNMRRAAEEAVREFRDWGFLSRERPVVHVGGRRKILGSWGAASRRNIVLRLLEKQGSVSVGDYLEEIEHTISRQQALQDMKAIPRIAPRGKGRGSVWAMGGAMARRSGTGA